MEDEVIMTSVEELSSETLADETDTAEIADQGQALQANADQGQAPQAKTADRGHADRGQAPQAENTTDDQDTAPARPTRAPKKAKPRKRRKWVKWVIILLILGGLVGFGYFKAREAAKSMYQEDVAAKRDIVTYHSFTGTIAAVDTQNLMASINGVKVKEVVVKEGDQVKKGDIIARLDSSTVEQQIAEKEAGMNATRTSNELQIQSASNAYNNLKSNINNGLDAATTSAKNSIDSAYAQLTQAKDAYNSEVELNNNGMSATIMSAQNQLQSAYSQLDNAQLSLKNAEDTRENARNTAYRNHYDQLAQAEQNLNKVKESYAFAYTQANDPDILAQTGTGEQTPDNNQSLFSALQAVNDAQYAYDKLAYKSDQEIFDSLSYDQQIANAQKAVTTAQQSYDQAQVSYEAAKANEESSLTRLYDQMVSAQNAYLASVDSYNTTVNSNNQQLQTYATQIQQAQANADTTLADLQLEDLKKNLDDYVITAPISGELTSLGIKSGDVLGSQPTSLGTIINFDKMKVDIKIGEYDIMGINVGDPVTITASALNKQYKGYVKHIDRVATVNNGVSYFGAEVDFDGDDDVRSGMSAEVRVTVNDLHGVVTVISDALQTADDGSSYVLVKDTDGKTMIHWPVTLGATDGTYTEIQKGLAEGETVYYNEILMNAMEQMRASIEESEAEGSSSDD